MRILPVKRRIKGRAVPYDPPNRFETVHLEMDPGQPVDEKPRTEFLPDSTRAIVSRNQSPDVGFDASVNPYRGCEHGCVYCYARPTHEYLGFSSGLDFERKILVKHRAPQLLREALSAPGWKPRVIGMSGVTDAYQPVERGLELTRGCLEVLRDFRNPVAIVTKNHLVTRDTDLLSDLAAHDCVHVTVSVTTLRNELQRVMEPQDVHPREAPRRDPPAGLGRGSGGGVRRTGDPRAYRRRGPRDRQGGGRSGGHVRVVPAGEAPEWVWRSTSLTGWRPTFPTGRTRCSGRIRQARGGKLNDSAFHRRFRGEGQYAKQIEGLFRAAVRKAGLEGSPPPLSTAGFRRDGGAQRELFAG